MMPAMINGKKLELVPEGAQRAGPVVKGAFTELREIQCPHCGVGFAVVAFKRPTGKSVKYGLQVDLRRVYECNTCGQPFRIKPLLRFVGVSMEEPNGG